LFFSCKRGLVRIFLVISRESYGFHLDPYCAAHPIASELLNEAQSVRKIPTRYLLHIIPLKPEERAVFSARQRADVRFEKHDPNGNQIELFCAEPGI
jgi:hypothetical protein